MDIHLYVIQSRFELGSKKLTFMKNDKIISPTNLFQHLLSAEILSEWKIEFILGSIDKKLLSHLADFGR